MGSSGERTSPCAPISSSAPVWTCACRACTALLIIHTKKPPSSAAVKITIGTEISNASLSVSNSSSPPNASATTPPDSQRAVADDERLRREQPEGEQDQQQPGDVDRQLREPEQREDQRHAPERAGQDHARG